MIEPNRRCLVVAYISFFLESKLVSFWTRNWHWFDFNLAGLTAIVKQSVAQGCASGWESQVANGTNCFMFMPDDHMGWNDAQVIACKYY